MFFPSQRFEDSSSLSNFCSYSILSMSSGASDSFNSDSFCLSSNFSFPVVDEDKMYINFNDYNLKKPQSSYSNNKYTYSSPHLIYSSTPCFSFPYIFVNKNNVNAMHKLKAGEEKTKNFNEQYMTYNNNINAVPCSSAIYLPNHFPCSMWQNEDYKNMQTIKFEKKKKHKEENKDKSKRCTLKSVYPLSPTNLNSNVSIISSSNSFTSHSTYSSYAGSFFLPFSHSSFKSSVNSCFLQYNDSDLNSTMRSPSLNNPIISPSSSSSNQNSINIQNDEAMECVNMSEQEITNLWKEIKMDINKLDYYDSLFKVLISDTKKIQKSNLTKTINNETEEEKEENEEERKMEEDQKNNYLFNKYLKIFLLKYANWRSDFYNSITKVFNGKNYVNSFEFIRLMGLMDPLSPHGNSICGFLRIRFVFFYYAKSKNKTLNSENFQKLRKDIAIYNTNSNISELCPKDLETAMKILNKKRKKMTFLDKRLEISLLDFIQLIQLKIIRGTSRMFRIFLFKKNLPIFSLEKITILPNSFYECEKVENKKITLGTFSNDCTSSIMPGFITHRRHIGMKDDKSLSYFSNFSDSKMADALLDEKKSFIADQVRSKGGSKNYRTIDKNNTYNFHSIDKNYNSCKTNMYKLVNENNCNYNNKNKLNNLNLLYRKNKMNVAYKNNVYFSPKGIPLTSSHCSSFIFSFSSSTHYPSFSSFITSPYIHKGSVPYRIQPNNQMIINEKSGAEELSKAEASCFFVDNHNSDSLKNHSNYVFKNCMQYNTNSNFNNIIHYSSFQNVYNQFNNNNFYKPIIYNSYANLQEEKILNNQDLKLLKEVTHDHNFCFFSNFSSLPGSSCNTYSNSFSSSVPSFFCSSSLPSYSSFSNFASSIPFSIYCSYSSPYSSLYKNSHALTLSKPLSYSSCLSSSVNSSLSSFFSSISCPVFSFSSYPSSFSFYFSSGFQNVSVPVVSASSEALSPSAFLSSGKKYLSVVPSVRLLDERKKNKKKEKAENVNMDNNMIKNEESKNEKKVEENIKVVEIIENKEQEKGEAVKNEKGKKMEENARVEEKKNEDKIIEKAEEVKNVEETNIEVINKKNLKIFDKNSVLFDSLISIKKDKIIVKNCEEKKQNKYKDNEEKEETKEIGKEKILTQLNKTNFAIPKLNLNFLLEETGNEKDESKSEQIYNIDCRSAMNSFINDEEKLLPIELQNIITSRRMGSFTTRMKMENEVQEDKVKIRTKNSKCLQPLSVRYFKKNKCERGYNLSYEEINSFYQGLKLLEEYVTTERVDENEKKNPKHNDSNINLSDQENKYIKKEKEEDKNNFLHISTHPNNFALMFCLEKRYGLTRKDEDALYLNYFNFVNLLKLMNCNINEKLNQNYLADEKPINKVNSSTFEGECDVLEKKIKERFPWTVKVIELIQGFKCKEEIKSLHVILIYFHMKLFFVNYTKEENEEEKDINNVRFRSELIKRIKEIFLEMRDNKINEFFKIYQKKKVFLDSRNENDFNHNYLHLIDEKRGLEPQEQNNKSIKDKVDFFQKIISKKEQKSNRTKEKSFDKSYNEKDNNHIAKRQSDINIAEYNNKICNQFNDDLNFIFSCSSSSSSFSASIDSPSFPFSPTVSSFSFISSSFLTSSLSSTHSLSSSINSPICSFSIYSPSVSSPPIHSPSVSFPPIHSASVSSPPIHSPSVSSPPIHSPSVSSPLSCHSVSSYVVSHSLPSSSVFYPSVTSCVSSSPSISSCSAFSPVSPVFSSTFSLCPTTSISFCSSSLSALSSLSPIPKNHFDEPKSRTISNFEGTPNAEIPNVNFHFHQSFGDFGVSTFSSTLSISSSTLTSSTSFLTTKNLLLKDSNYSNLCCNLEKECTGKKNLNLSFLTNSEEISNGSNTNNSLITPYTSPFSNNEHNMTNAFKFKMKNKYNATAFVSVGEENKILNLMDSSPHEKFFPKFSCMKKIEEKEKLEHFNEDEATNRKNSNFSEDVNLISKEVECKLVGNKNEQNIFPISTPSCDGSDFSTKKVNKIYRNLYDENNKNNEKNICALKPIKKMIKEEGDYFQEKKDNLLVYNNVLFLKNNTNEANIINDETYYDQSTDIVLSKNNKINARGTSLVNKNCLNVLKKKNFDKNEKKEISNEKKNIMNKKNQMQFNNNSISCLPYDVWEKNTLLEMKNENSFSAIEEKQPLSPLATSRKVYSSNYCHTSLPVSSPAISLFNTGEKVSLNGFLSSFISKIDNGIQMAKEKKETILDNELKEELVNCNDSVLYVDDHEEINSSNGYIEEKGEQCISKQATEESEDEKLLNFNL